MTGDGYPYKFVTLHENEEYICFLRMDDTIKKILVEFLQITLRPKYLSSQDYGAQTMFGGKRLSQELMIKNVFQTKKDNNVFCNMPKEILTRSNKGIKSNFQGKSIIPTQLASNNNDRLKMSDDNKSLSNTNPGKSFWSNSDVVSKKITSLPVFKVHQCLRNN